MSYFRKKLIRAALFLLFLFFCAQAFAQNYSGRDKIMSGEFQRIAQNNAASDDNIYFKSRESVMEQILSKLEIEVALKYFFAHGPQNFQVGQDGLWRSRLVFPRRGGMVFYSGEIKYPPFSIGGTYGHSFFDKTTCTDTDWDLTFSPEVWLESNSRCAPQTQAWDINFYYRLLEQKKSEGMDTEKKEVLEILRVDDIALDIFGGYQQEKGHYRMNDGIQTVDEYVPVRIPFPDLDSFFKIEYQGPRLGCRVEGSKGKLSSRLTFAYAWLEANGYGWWNLRPRQFWLKHGKGYNVDFNLDLAYDLTSNLSVGAGYKYMFSETKGGRYQFLDPGDPLVDLDAWQESTSTLCGFTLMVKYAF